MQRQLSSMADVNLIYFNDLVFMAFCYPLLLSRCDFLLKYDFVPS